jgi:lipopolysaccharide transport system ATP-binding protein
MSDTVIKVENLYKQYRLGQVSTGTIAHDLNRWFHKVRGKEDPYEMVTGLNTRDIKDNSEYVWALQNINFEVKQGEVLGIIGKNGAGKSTLLKILSKVTAPTRGEIKVKGRIASLLEVGTGFHPELTGRENIFLNGAILGMSKSEIRSKFDEIVAFSGVEKYIDTPVKRYSSGMYVRLAFAVAAHLEPEILIVDEVLAVGDAEFQKRCLGKMKDVSNQGRTVLFVSHNIQAIESLCDRVILMENGTKKTELPKHETIKNYIENSLMQTRSKSLNGFRENSIYGQRIKIIKIVCAYEFYWTEKLKIKFELEKIDQLLNEIEFGIGINSISGNRIFTFESKESYSINETNKMTFDVIFDQPTLVPGNYLISIGVRSLTQTLDFLEFVHEFSVKEINQEGKHFGFSIGESSGYIDTNVSVTTKKD